MTIAGNQRNENRDKTDLYPTDRKWVEVLLRHVTLTGTIWERADGLGNISDALKSASYAVKRSDILTGTDFLREMKPWNGSIVTNPPYKLANEFIVHALSLARGRIAMLLPIGYLAGSTRLRKVYRKEPPSKVIVVVNRMVVNDKTSQFNHVWVVWERKGGGQTEMIWDEAK